MGIPPRTVADLYRSAQSRADRDYLFPAVLKVDKSTRVAVSPVTGSAAFGVARFGSVLAVEFGAVRSGSLRVTGLDGTVEIERRFAGRSALALPAAGLRPGIHLVSTTGPGWRAKKRIFIR